MMIDDEFLNFYVTGGAVSNLYAALVARHAVLPSVKTKGLAAMPQLVMFESDQVCYICFPLVFATDNIILIF